MTSVRTDWVITDFPIQCSPAVSDSLSLTAGHCHCKISTHLLCPHTNLQTWDQTAQLVPVSSWNLILVPLTHTQYESSVLNSWLLCSCNELDWVSPAFTDICSTTLWNTLQRINPLSLKGKSSINAAEHFFFIICCTNITKNFSITKD